MGVGGAVLAFAAAAAYKFSMLDIVRLPDVGLTEQECQLTHTIFGDEIDCAKIKKHFSPQSRADVSARTVGWHDIVFYGENQYSPDFSQEKKVFNYGLFVHEMTHVWQMKHWFSQTKLYCENTYRYDHAPGRRFESYCSEQQASLVEDYARRFLYPVAVSSNSYKSFHKEDTAQSDRFLMEVVEGKFPRLRAERLRVAARRDLDAGLQSIRP